jgi:peptide subunit release factor 1 (eRF1)
MTLGIIVIGIVAVLYIVYHFESKKPEFSCKHDYTEPMKTFNGKYSNKYFRTCKNCGKRDEFYGHSVHNG